MSGSLVAIPFLDPLPSVLSSSTSSSKQTYNFARDERRDNGLVFLCQTTFSPASLLSQLRGTNGSVTHMACLETEANRHRDAIQLYYY